jgi:hypothetical protein
MSGASLKSAETKPGRISLIETSTSGKTDSVTKLTGSENYQTWETQVEYLLISIDAEDIVLEGLTLPDNVTADEERIFRKTTKHALTILVQTLSTDVLTSYPRRLTPHEIWVHLRSLYYQENAFTFQTQLRKVTHLDAAGSDISAFIQHYEKEWALLVRLTASANQSTNESRQYRKDFVTFLLHDRAKRDFLLASHLDRYPNELDNISTNDVSTFQEVKNKFLNLHSATTSSESALITAGGNKKRNFPTNKKSKATKPSPSSSSAPAPKSKAQLICTWCLKHHLSRANGHGWNDCSKLKDFTKILLRPTRREKGRITSMSLAITRTQIRT